MADKVGCALMQPTFLPWQGYFELVLKSDTLVFLDDFQFVVRSYHQRNRLFVGEGRVDWYTVPISKPDRTQAFLPPLNTTRISESDLWREKMWNRIHHNYCKTAHYGELAAWVREWLTKKHPSLAEQNMEFIRWSCRVMGFDREFLLSSGIATAGARSLRILEILRACRASTYYCARGSFDYMLEDHVFPVEDVSVLFQDFLPRPYPQAGSLDFVPSLSVLDAFFNIGPARTLELIEGGTAKWLTWDDMVARQAPRV